MAIKKTKDKKPTAEVENGAKKYVGALLMLVGCLALLFIFMLIIIRTVPIRWEF